MEIKNDVLRRLVANRMSDLSAQKYLGASDTLEQTDNSQLSQYDTELLKRGLCRRVSTIISEQKNWEDVVQHADAILQDQEDTSNSKKINQEELDQGWVDYCIEGAGKTYNEDLKQYFAKLLAGEIKSPGKYSKRAIQFFRSISQKDAVKIKDMCQYVVYNYDNTDAVILRYKPSDYTFDEISFLMELRLLNYDHSIVKQYRFEENEGACFYRKKDVGLYVKIRRKEYNLPIYSFTELGKEILTIVDDEIVNRKYLIDFSKSITQKKDFLEIVGGDLVEIDNSCRIVKNENYFEVPETGNTISLDTLKD